MKQGFRRFYKKHPIQAVAYCLLAWELLLIFILPLLLPASGFVSFMLSFLSVVAGAVASNVFFSLRKGSPAFKAFVEQAIKQDQICQTLHQEWTQAITDFTNTIPRLPFDANKEAQEQRRKTLAKGEEIIDKPFQKKLFKRRTQIEKELRKTVGKTLNNEQVMKF